MMSISGVISTYAGAFVTSYGLLKKIKVYRKNISKFIITKVANILVINCKKYWYLMTVINDIHSYK